MDEKGDSAPSNDREELNKRHRTEKKELQNKIQSMKKSIPKGDKKKKKEISDEIIKLEKELAEKHAEELNKIVPELLEQVTKTTNTEMPEFQINGEEQIPATTNYDDDDEEIISPKVTRAQKRRNKKQTEEREREKRISEQAEKNKDGPRILELNTIKKSLEEMNLQIHNIPAYGNCLYLAVKHQLHISGQQTQSVAELRKKTANFMRSNKDDFLPFMYNEDDNEDVDSEETFESYCKDVEKTKLWGGQLELKALSNILECPIKVIQASGPPTIQGENFKGPELILTYHRHLYKLGEHYNSTLSITENRAPSDNDDDCDEDSA